MNRSQFVRALGVAYSTVLHWESGKTRPNADNLQRICEVTGASMPHLLTGRLGSDNQRDASPELSRFLATTLGSTATQEERRLLAAIDFGSTEPTLESYHAALLSLRLGRKPRPVRHVPPDPSSTE